MRNEILYGLALCFLTGQADANSGIYVSAKAGATMLRSTGNTLQGSGTVGALQNTLGTTALDIQSQTHFSPALAIGYDFNDIWEQPVRLELAFSSGAKVSGTEFATGSVISRWSNSSSASSYRDTFNADVYRKQKTELSTLMANAYYDYRTDFPVTPWVMGGVGIAFIHSTMSGGGSAQGIVVDSGEVSGRVSRVAWAAGAGLSWAMTPHIAMDAGYRFTNAGEINISGEASDGIVSGAGKTRSRLQLHTVEVGLRYTF